MSNAECSPESTPMAEAVFACMAIARSEMMLYYDEIAYLRWFTTHRTRVYTEMNPQVVSAKLARDGLITARDYTKTLDRIHELEAAVAEHMARQEAAITDMLQGVHVVAKSISGHPFALRHGDQSERVTPECKAEASGPILRVRIPAMQLFIGTEAESYVCPLYNYDGTPAITLHIGQPDTMVSDPTSERELVLAPAS